MKQVSLIDQSMNTGPRMPMAERADEAISTGISSFLLGWFAIVAYAIRKRLYNVLSRNGTRCLISLVLGLPMIAQGVIIPADRCIDWTQVGVPGGVPAITQIFCNVEQAIPGTNLTARGDGVTDDTVALQTAINLCPAGQVVYLPSGTYKINTGLTGKRSIVLRGDGTNTVIAPYGQTAGPGFLNFQAATQGFYDQASWLANFSKGTTNIILSTTVGKFVNLRVGDEILLDQSNNPVLVNNVGSEGPSGGGGRTPLDGTRSQCQYVRITALSGTNVTFWPPLYSSYSPSQQPQAWWKDGGNVMNVGIENLKIDASNSTNDYNIVFQWATYCWIENVESISAKRGHVKLYSTLCCEVRDSYFHGSKAHSTESYGVELLVGSCGNLIENNIFNDLTSPIVFGYSSSGNVVSYNYLTNLYFDGSGWIPPAISVHDAHCMMNLFEGNIAPNVYCDFIHGSSSHQTIFRNSLAGYEDGKNGQCYAIVAQATNLFLNVIGNVLGTQGQSDTYMLENVVCSGSEKAIYRLGYFSTSCSLDGYDTNVLSTAILHGNYDPVTITNEGIVWSPSISDRTLPVSLYLTAKPAWFGNRRWPAIDPHYPGLANMTNIPAGYRFVFGTNPPAGELPPLPPTGFHHE